MPLPFPRRNSRDQRWSATDAAHRSFAVSAISDVVADESLIFTAGELHLDLSRNLVNARIVNALIEDFGTTVCSLRDRMFAGEKVNSTEDRKVMHVALRDSLLGSPESVEANGVINQMSRFADGVRSGGIRSSTGKKFTHVINIGIGGSDLGPAMAYEALAPYCDAGIEVRFASNVDPESLDSALAGINPETTLVVVVSKTFTTIESMTNFNRLKEEFARRAPGLELREHIVAVTANVNEAMSRGFTNVLPMWDWVGGRYSIGSAVGLSLMIAIGSDRFREMLAGMHEIDSHFATAPLAKNAPFLLGAIDAYYGRHRSMHSRAVVPYASAMATFPAYLQQLEMESNGKGVGRDGQRIASTAVPVWGGAGTDGQHAYFQFLHQGTEFVAIDLVGFARTRSVSPGNIQAQRILLANLVAQSTALAFGARSEDPHKDYPGNRPVNVLLADQLTPRVLGQLIALYEHRVLVQGAIWNINSFDQWGVELGKSIAGRIETQLVPSEQAVFDTNQTAATFANAPTSIAENRMLRWLKSHLD